MSSSSSTSDNNCPDTRLQLCEERIQYQFSDREILRQALTHSSSASTRLDCNERMEFLGDAVLGVAICEYLYEHFPEHREGQLTQQKSRLVSRSVCTQVGQRLGLNELISVGRGLTKIPDSLTAAAVEAVIAAVYLDGGFSAAAAVIRHVFESELTRASDADTENYKSLLQEETQREGNVTPDYIVLEERGPDHAREFQITVRIGDRSFDPAWGRSKKEAEQKAAMNALNSLNEL